MTKELRLGSIGDSGEVELLADAHRVGAQGAFGAEVANYAGAVR